MRIVHIVIIGIFLLICVGVFPSVSVPKPVSNAAGISYYVSPSGNDANDGLSASAAWRSIDKVNSTNLQPGTTVYFQGGATFNGTIYLNSADSGTSTNPVTFTSYGTGRATINAGNGKGLQAQDVGGIVIKNLNFIGSGPTTNTYDGVGFFMDYTDGRKISFIRITQVDISGFGRAGLYFGSNGTGNGGYSDVAVFYVNVHDNSDGMLTWGPTNSATGLPANENFYIGYSKFYNNSGVPGTHTGNGIVLGNVNGGIIGYSEAFNNGANGGDSHGGPVGIWTYMSNNIKIQFNESHHNKTAITADGGGFDLDGGSTNCITQYNYSHNNYGAGYLVWQYTGATAHNGNLICYNISQNDGRKNSYGAIEIGAASGASPVTNAYVYNNTIFVSPTTDGSIPVAVKTYGALSNVNLRNNILVTMGGVPLINANATAGLTFQGNNYYTSGAAFKILWGGTIYTSLSTWRATGQEKNGSSLTGFILGTR